MLLYAQTWLPLLTITLTAAIFFGVASFMMADAALATINRGNAYDTPLSVVALMAIADYFERTPEWPQEIGTDPGHHARCPVVRPAIGRS